jgi:hypothetical protein
MLICSNLLSQAVAKQDSEILAAFDQPLQIFGNVSTHALNLTNGD